MGHVSVPPCLLEQLVRVSRACARLAEIVATAAVFTAGCSFSDGGDRGQVPLDPRPLSAVLVTSVADTARLREQEESAVAHCMARRGFRYVPERTTVSERTVTTNPYGLLREMQAHQDGYGVVGEILSGTGNRPPPAVHHSAGWTKALEVTHVEKFTLSTGVVLTYRPDGCAYRGRNPRRSLRSTRRGALPPVAGLAHCAQTGRIGGPGHPVRAHAHHNECRLRRPRPRRHPRVSQRWSALHADQPELACWFVGWEAGVASAVRHSSQASALSRSWSLVNRASS